MRLSRRSNTIILWVISIGLMVGMIITFTPTLGNFFGGSQGGAQDGGTALLVNGQPISQLDVSQLQQQNHALSAIQEGEMRQDIELLILDSLVRNEVLRQAASSMRVSGGDFRTAFNNFRESQGVAGARNDDAYLRLVNNLGYTDQTFRDALRAQLRLQSYQDGITEAVTVSDAEIEAYYTLNQDNYRSDERVSARMIVVDDETLAGGLRERALAGEAFAALATDNSLERADRGGAVGAPAGSSEPQPVGRAALPTAVAAAAFSLEGGGLTEVIEVAGRYYLVSVEAFQAATIQPLSEVRASVENDALTIKQQQVLEAETERLVTAAEVTVPDGSLSRYQDPVVARVGSNDILTSQLVRATYTNPQIQQALSPQNASLITQFFKPSFLANLIDQELAFQGAQQLDATFLGTRAQVAQSALNYVSRDADATSDEIDTFYQENLARYTIAPSADVTQVTFDDAAGAGAFREALLAGIGLAVAADAGGGTVEEIGVVGQGDLDVDLDAVLFTTDGFEPLAGGDLEVSDVLVLSEVDASGATDTNLDSGAAEPVADGVVDDGASGDDAAGTEAAVDGAAGDVVAGDVVAGDTVAGAAVDGAADVVVLQRFVVLVAARTPEQVRSLDDVRDQVEVAVLAAERSELRGNWLTQLREEIGVVDLLNPAPDFTTEEPVDTEDAGAADTQNTPDTTSDNVDGGEPAAAEETP